jgi:hypothetical protein
MTGLAAGSASGPLVYESRHAPGGICSSSYVQPGDRERQIKASGRRKRNDVAYFCSAIGGINWDSVSHGKRIQVSWLTSVTKVSTCGRPSGFT